MLYVDKVTGQVELTRGDSGRIVLNINQGSVSHPVRYKLKPTDKVFFALEEPNQPFEMAIVKKVLTLENSLLDRNGDLIIEFTPNDTQCLMPGLYYYEIKAIIDESNKFRNAYLLLTFDPETYQFKIYDEEKKECLMIGTYTIENENIYILTSSTGEVYEDELGEDNRLTIDGITYQQEQAKVNTLIPQTKFTIGR